MLQKSFSLTSTLLTKMIFQLLTLCEKIWTEGKNLVSAQHNTRSGAITRLLGARAAPESSGKTTLGIYRRIFCQGSYKYHSGNYKNWFSNINVDNTKLSVARTLNQTLCLAPDFLRQFNQKWKYVFLLS